MSDLRGMHPETRNHPLTQFVFLTIFVLVVYGFAMGGYRFIMSFWDLEDRVWQMPYLILTSIISLITIGTTVTILIKSKRAGGAAGQNKK
jgi:hypothetical protein